MSEPKEYIEYNADGSARAFVGASAVAIYQATVIKHAIAMYAATGLKANRAYTPANMRHAAEKITGKKFKARAYADMVAALEEWIATNRPKVAVVQQEAR